MAREGIAPLDQWTRPPIRCPGQCKSEEELPRPTSEWAVQRVPDRTCVRRCELKAAEYGHDGESVGAITTDVKLSSAALSASDNTLS